jgi:hypothetical protein
MKSILMTAAVAVLAFAGTANAALMPWESDTFHGAAAMQNTTCPPAFGNEYVVQNKATGGWLKVFSNKTPAGALLNGEPKLGVNIGQVLSDPAFSSAVAGVAVTPWTPYCVEGFSAIAVGNFGTSNLSTAGIVGQWFKVTP